MPMEEVPENPRDPRDPRGRDPREVLNSTRVLLTCLLTFFLCKLSM